MPDHSYQDVPRSIFPGSLLASMIDRLSEKLVDLKSSSIKPVDAKKMRTECGIFNPKQIRTELLSTVPSPKKSEMKQKVKL